MYIAEIKDLSLSPSRKSQITSKKGKKRKTGEVH
jgi:hypothetical protein